MFQGNLYTADQDTVIQMSLKFASPFSRSNGHNILENNSENLVEHRIIKNDREIELCHLTIVYIHRSKICFRNAT